MSRSDFRSVVQDLREAMKRRGIAVHVEDGLNEEEFERLQTTLDIDFPPDLRQFLASGLPVSPDYAPGFPNWRSAPVWYLRDLLQRPFDRVLREVEEGQFWWQTWGAQPADVTQASNVARAQLSRAPKLIPIYQHRYLPASPRASGNPVFSVMQTDVVLYGNDLLDYLVNEFGIETIGPEARSRAPRHIPFWSDLVTWGDNTSPTTATDTT